jgi:hypothetical protein
MCVEGINHDPSPNSQTTKRNIAFNDDTIGFINLSDERGHVRLRA